MTDRAGLGVVVVGAALLIAACGGAPAAGADGGHADAGATDASTPDETCTDDVACDDGLFCNGAERCAPDDPRADALGCAPADDPCAAHERCEEADDRCAADDCADPDADGDGHDRTSCGGRDCDDTDRHRYPGNTEICDLENVDEDCDPRTFGVRDLDGDGETDALCCNDDGVGATRCGLDCDDTRGAVRPGATEICNARDDDCDGAVDEEQQITFHPDADGDGHGDPSGTPITGCTQPAGYAARADDCDDDDPARFPGNAETCDAANLDEDCDGVANPETLCTCSEGQTRPCARAGACASGTEMCTLAGTWGACSIEAVPEICNMVDDDCDGVVDDGVSIACYVDADNDRYPAVGAALVRACTTAGREAVGGCPPYTTNRDPAAGADCEDTLGRGFDVHPGASELCNGVDDDCDSTIDEGVLSGMPTWYVDCDSDGYSPLGAASRMQCGRPSEPTGCPGGGGAWQSSRPISVPANVDCNDTVATVYPGADERCDGYDTDCRRDSLHGLDFLHEDDDDDGYADCSGLPIGRFDCDDASAAVSPAATDAIADGVDSNCDGQEICYRNADGDGHRLTTLVTTTAIACPASMGLALASLPTGDCCDTDPGAYPGATLGSSTTRARCGGYDYDCDGVETRMLTRVSSGTCTTTCTDGWCTCSAPSSLSGWLSSAPACGGLGTLVTGCSERETGACNGRLTEERAQTCR